MGPLWGVLAWAIHLQEAHGHEAQDRGADEPRSGVLGALPNSDRLTREGRDGGQGPGGQARYGGQPR